MGRPETVVNARSPFGTGQEIERGPTPAVPCDERVRVRAAPLPQGVCCLITNFGLLNERRARGWWSRWLWIGQVQGVRLHGGGHAKLLLYWDQGRP